MRVRRIDVGTLAAPVRRADGSVIVEARIARTGVQTYRNKDGSTRVEYRPDAEVSRSMQSLRLVPVTHKHPPKMLDASNAKTFAVGAVGENIRRDGDWIVAPLAIFDAKTIAAMDAGKNQVSAGYECELDETPGTTPTGERYDAIQRDIVVNHVATALDNARAGREAAARMDALAVDELEERHDTMDPQEQIRALKLRCDENDVKAKERQDALDAATGERDAAQGEVKTLKERVSALEGQIAAGAQAMETEAVAAQRTRADAAEASLEQMRASREAEIRAAAELRIKAQAVMGDKFRCDGLSDRAIRELVVKKLAPKEDVNEKTSDAYLTSRCDSLIEAHVANARSLTRVSEVMAPGAIVTPAAPVDTKESRAKAWREPDPNFLKQFSTKE